jgi:hypothetical protein
VRRFEKSFGRRRHRVTSSASNPTRRNLIQGLAASPFLARAAAEKRPNIILIVLDDQRWDAFGPAAVPACSIS